MLDTRNHLAPEQAKNALTQTRVEQEDDQNDGLVDVRVAVVERCFSLEKFSRDHIRRGDTDQK